VSDPAAVSRRPAADTVAGAAVGALALLFLAVAAHRLGRPFWYNEQWRAFHLSLPRTLLHPRSDTNAPISFGVAALTRASTALLGNTELALRLPMAVSLPALAVLTYLLGRRWLGVTASVLTVVALLLNRMVLTFATELAPYTVEAACAVAIVLLWLGERHRPWRYAAIAALSVIATPAVFVLAPLLATDLVRAVRAREWRPLVAPVATGAVALLHLAVYVTRQSAQAGGDYWQNFYVPHSPAGAASAVWRGLAGYVPRALTGGTSHFPLVPDGELTMPGGLRVVLVVAMTAVLLLGLVLGLRDPAARVLPVTLLGMLGAEVVAALAGYWPFGFTRVNTFLLPFGYLLAALGATRLPRRAVRVPAVLAGAAAYVLVLSVGVRQAGIVRRELDRPAFGARLGVLADVVRHRAGPADAVVLVHPMTEKGWAYYTRQRAGTGGVRIPAGRTLVVSGSDPDPDAVTAFVGAHPDAVHVWLVALTGSRPSTVAEAAKALAALGYTQRERWTAEVTGGMREFVKGG
jgi:hypothetical protein